MFAITRKKIKRHARSSVTKTVRIIMKITIQRKNHLLCFSIQCAHKNKKKIIFDNLKQSINLSDLLNFIVRRMNVTFDAH